MKDIDSVVLVSGGTDSVVCLFEEAASGYKAGVLFLDYGQNPTEKETVTRICKDYGFSMESLIVNLGGDRQCDEMPARNAIFLTYALRQAIKNGATRVVAGFAPGPGLFYMDVSTDFKRTMSEVFALWGIALHTPLLGTITDKTDVFVRGLNVGAPLHLMISCISDSGGSCGVCRKCLQVDTAFLELFGLSRERAEPELLAYLRSGDRAMAVSAFSRSHLRVSQPATLTPRGHDLNHYLKWAKKQFTTTV